MQDSARTLPAIFVGGLLVGVLDLTYAILVYRPRKPILIPQTIASGILGNRAYDGGAQTARAGSCSALFHCLRCFDSVLPHQSQAVVLNSSLNFIGSHLRRTGLPFHAPHRSTAFCGAAWAHAIHLPGMRIRRALVLRWLTNRSLGSTLFTVRGVISLPCPDERILNAAAGQQDERGSQVWGQTSKEQTRYVRFKR